MPLNNSLDTPLKLIIQPQDGGTKERLYNLGFEPIPNIPQLCYQIVTQGQLRDIFGKLTDALSELSQAASRFLVTRSPLDDSSMLMEFLQAQPLSAITNSVKYSWFLRLLVSGGLFFKYQPIFHLASGNVIAHECLARATSEQGQILSGKQLIDAAIATRLTCEFDELARTKCFELISNINSQQTFFINILPNAIIRNPQSLEDNLQQVVELGLRPQQIVFELTEVEVLAHCPDLPTIINRLRDLGFGIAVDDLCGCVSVDHYVMEFRPDLVKLDRRLIDGCSKHPLKQTLIKSIVQSAREEGILVLAEGLEEAEDIEFCRALGVDYGQGFGLARPNIHLWQQPLETMGFSHAVAS